MSKHLEHEIIVGPSAQRAREGYIKGLNETERAALEARLREVLSGYGVEVTVQPVMVHDDFKPSEEVAPSDVSLRV